MIIKRTEAEINMLLNNCSLADEFGSTLYPGMTYEQGIKAALLWLLDGQEHPFS